jgi:hypothetical protein
VQEHSKKARVIGMNDWVWLGLILFAAVVDDDWVLPTGILFLIWETI